MKKSTLAVVIGASLISSVAQADTIAGLYVGAQGWDSAVSGGFSDTSTTSDFSFEDKTNSAIYVAFEHPVPLIPNVKVNYTTMDTSGDTLLETNFTFNDQLFTASSTISNDVELTSTDLILYYEIFDNDLISFDLGINGKYIDGTLFVEDVASATSTSADFSGVIPMVYSKVQLGLPFTGLAVYAEGSYLSFDDHEVSDYQVAATYSFIESLAIDMTLQLGYRNVTVDIEDLDDIYTDLTFDGVFAGLEVHF